ncbi:hypothetical protein [Brevibacillus sp. FIR094]|uniref:hypothetical protein n=1 Tax=Brevibacillus sp. FIR094 TaxID=3134809 RepID=UPI003D23A14E
MTDKKPAIRNIRDLLYVSNKNHEIATEIIGLAVQHNWPLSEFQSAIGCIHTQLSVQQSDRYGEVKYFYRLDLYHFPESLEPFKEQLEDALFEACFNIYREYLQKVEASE